MEVFGGAGDRTDGVEPVRQVHEATGWDQVRCRLPAGHPAPAGFRTFRQQKELNDRFLEGTGNLAARPATEFTNTAKAST